MHKKSQKLNMLLIFLCWLAYTAAYLGRLNYNANIIHIVDFFNTTKSNVGLVSSFFFFAYGAGQFVHGMLSKYYNPKIAIAVSLISSAVINFLMPVCNSLLFMKILWLLNGFIQAILWSSLTRILGQFLDEKYLNKSIIVMGTSTALGTAVTYLLSSFFVRWQLSFYVATIVLLLVGVIWLVLYDKITKSMNGRQFVVKKQSDGKNKANKGFGMLLVVILIFAVFNNIIRDGLTTWTPSIFYEMFNLPQSLSILVTVCLPLIAALGSTVCVIVSRYIKNHIALCGLFYLVGFVALLAMVLLLPYKIWWVTLIIFIVCSLSMAAINNVITSLMPLKMRHVTEPGKLSGITNAFCYVGSTISSYLLGSLGDILGWNGAFYFLFIMTFAAILICIVYFAVSGKFKLKI